MWILDVPEKVLAKEEVFIRNRAEFAAPDSWSVRHGWAKLRRLRGDRQSLTDMGAVAEQHYQLFPRDKPENLITSAVMYLQAGEEEPGRQMLEEARTLLEAELAEHPGPDTGLLLDVLFLLREGDRAEQALAELRVARPDTVRPILRHPVLADLARARTTKDAELAAAAVARLHAMARGQRGFYTGAGLTLWDFYEQALIVQAEITGTPPPELREI